MFRGAMIRGVCILICAANFVGCRAPMPTFNPLAPYGQTRIPPPGTGSFVTPNSYYQAPPTGTPAPAAGGTGFRPSLDTRRAAAGETHTDQVVVAEPALAGPTQARPMPPTSAAATAPNADSAGSAIAPVYLTQPASVNLPLLRGMPVNQAVVGEPGLFVPLGDAQALTPIPDPATSAVAAPTAAVIGTGLLTAAAANANLVASPLQVAGVPTRSANSNTGSSRLVVSPSRGASPPTFSTGNAGGWQNRHGGSGDPSTILRELK